MPIPFDLQLILNQLLGELYVLLVKARRVHWYVEGVEFGPVHNWTGEYYDCLNEYSDCLAERIRALDAYPDATMSKWLKTSSIKEDDSVMTDPILLLTDLRDATATVIGTVSDATEKADLNTEALLTDLGAKLEKKLWMLKSMVK